MAATPIQQQDNEEEASAFSLDVILNIARRFWYLIILCAALGGAGAYYHAGKQPFVYQKTASVMLKQGNQQSYDRILKELGADPGAANLATTSYILKSTALMERVVEKLNLQVSYWKQQELRQVELYDKSPILVRFETIDAQKSCSLSVTPISEENYALTYTNNMQQQVSQDFRYGEKVELPFATVSVHPTSNMDPQYIGTEITVNRIPELAAARGFLATLTVTNPNSGDASMLQLTLTSSNPEKAEDVLDELIAAYNERSKEEKSEAAYKTDQFIRGRLEEIGKALTDVDQKINASKEEAEVLQDATTEFGDYAASVKEAMEQIENIEMQKKMVASLLENLNECRKEGMLLTVNTGVADAAISNKVEAYNTAFLEYSKISKSAGSRNPVAIALKEQMSAMLQAAYKAVQNYNNTMDMQLQDRQTKIAELKERMSKAKYTERSLAPLIREHKIKEELYILLLTKEQENALALAVTSPDARVLESAYGSNAPISPNANRIIAIGAIGGAGACIALLIGIGMLNNKVNTKHDLAAFTRQPVVGELPELSRKEKRGSGLIVKDNRSTMSECLHILRNNVDNLLPRPEKGGHIILLTSTMPNEGKTLLAANLAAAYAQAGRRVLLIDADLRKTSLTRDMGGKGRKGLTNLLLNHVKAPAEVIHRIEGVVQQGEETDQAGAAHILYAGTTVPNPITLLSAARFGTLLKELVAQYDAVIVDAPPQGILADTDIIARHADISLYIVRAGRIARKYFTQVQKLADTGKLPNLAYVLNAVDFRAHSYYQYGYSYGHYRYGYGNDTKEKA